MEEDKFYKELMEKYGKNKRIAGRKGIEVYRAELKKAAITETPTTAENPNVILRRQVLNMNRLHLVPDPRSPSQNINRSPLVCASFEDSLRDLSKNDSPFVNLATSWIASTPIQTNELDKTQPIANVIDPRSPTPGLKRTPILFTDDDPSFVADGGCNRNEVSIHESFEVLNDHSSPGNSSNETFYSCQSRNSFEKEFDQKMSLKLQASSAGRNFLQQLSHGVVDHSPRLRNRARNQQRVLKELKINESGPLDLRSKQKIMQPKRPRVPFACLRNRSKSVEHKNPFSTINYQQLMSSSQDDSLNYNNYRKS